MATSAQSTSTETTKPAEKPQKAKMPDKYGWLKTLLVVFLLVICIDEVIYVTTHKSPSVAQQTQVQTQASPTTIPTADSTKDWTTYSSPEGKFTIKYPSNYLLTDNSASTASIRLLSNVIPALNTNFRMTIQFKQVPGAPSLEQLIEQNNACTQITPQNGTPSTINGEEKAQIFIDTPCGQYISTVIYTMNNNIFYTITVETDAKFLDVKPYADAILATLKFN
jgi:hypothetical protein